MSWYKDFLGYRFMASYDENVANSLVVYRISANASDVVTTQGFSIIPAFNTPEHKFNIGFAFRDLIADIKLGSKTLKLRNLGFNINYKWVQGYQYEGSPQFTGYVPSYQLLDAQINYNAKKIKTTFKLGASNVFNQQRFYSYGSPYIGRMAYFSLLFELDRVMKME